MKNKLLSPNQEKIIDFIKSYMLTHPYSPSVREIAAAVGFSSTSSVQFQIDSLIKKGVLRRGNSKIRSLEIVNEFSIPEMANLPIIANQLRADDILNKKNILSYYPIVKSELPDGSCIAIQVSTNNLTEYNIAYNDLAFIHLTDAIDDRDIVLARVLDRIDLYMAKSVGNSYLLCVPNKEPVSSEVAIILGKLMGIHRLL